MGRIGVKSDYEELRNAQILENKARLASLGLQKTVAELRSISSKPQSEKRKYNKVDYFSTPLRRSNRLKDNSSESEKRKPNKVDNFSTPLRRSNRLKDNSSESEKRKPNKVDNFSTPLRRSNRLKDNSSELALRSSDRLNENSCRTAKRKLGLFEEGDDEDAIEKRPANAPLLRMKDGLMLHLTPEALARRCASKDRGTIYDRFLGICCHFCRQKKLCGEEDCKRCGNSDMDQPCLGKTDCSICHSSNGVLCRGCLKVRYGEEMEDVRANKEWICPHCTEEKGINPYWICNSSLCLKKRKMAPTGIAIFRAREMGYKSVAHLLMDQLQGAVKGR